MEEYKTFVDYEIQYYKDTIWPVDQLIYGFKAIPIKISVV